MNIKSVEVYNFTSYIHAILDLETNGVYNLIGLNGSGKSSLRDAITWCLFGKSRVSGAGDELIHNNEKEMRVVVTFDLGDKTFEVTRIRERNQNTRIDVIERDKPKPVGDVKV